MLEVARQWVILYLDWVSGDLASRAPAREVAHAIKLGADRLHAITLAMPQAFADQDELCKDWDEPAWRPELRTPPPGNFLPVL
ncbi:MAG TPA: hypothetical protein VHT93_08725 [Pseudolabrys sp.]|nr:hypothetical protein [Pseudolabrys sp.]